MRRTARADQATLACCRHDVAAGYTSRQYPHSLPGVGRGPQRRTCTRGQRAVLSPDDRRAIRMGATVLLVCGPLDANALVRRLDRLLGPGVHLGAVEEHGHHILELVISNEIANLELEIVLQMYRERVDSLDERLHEFRQSQELP